jgi:hypothetical protein
MTSLTSYTKQIPANAGYYINVAPITISNTAASFYQNNGTDELPSIAVNSYAISSITSTIMRTVGSAVFKDMGKTLMSSGRTFRKVQLVVSSLLTEGVGGADTAPTNYLTGYIELPGQHGITSSQGPFGGIGFTPVARLG